MGPVGFAPVPVAEFLGLDPEKIRTASLKCFYNDCEGGPRELEGREEMRALVLEDVVLGKANATMTTGGTVSTSFYDEDGRLLGSIELYDGLLVAGDGMYHIGEEKP